MRTLYLSQQLLIWTFLSWEGGEIMLFIPLFNVFVFVGCTTLQSFIEFWLVDSLNSVPKRFNNYLYSTEGVILCIIIVELHQFSAIVLSLLSVLVPVMIYALTEQNFSSKELLNEPKLYKNNRGNGAMNLLHIFG